MEELNRALFAPLIHAAGSRSEATRCVQPKSGLSLAGQTGMSFISINMYRSVP
jgi:hypothetical protein